MGLVRTSGAVGSPAGVRLAGDTSGIVTWVSGTNEYEQTRRVGNAGGWAAWVSMGTDTFASVPAAIGFDEDVPGSDRYAVFGLKSDGRYYGWLGRASDGQALVSWTAISSETFESAPTVAIAGGVIWIVGRKSDGLLYAASQELASGAEPFSVTGFGAFVQLPALDPISGLSFVGNPAVSGATFWRSGGPAFFARLSNGRYATNVMYTDGTYSGWRELSAQTFTADPQVTSSSRSGRTGVYGVSSSQLQFTSGFLDEWEDLEQFTSSFFFVGTVDGLHSFGGPPGKNLGNHLFSNLGGRIYAIGREEHPGGSPRIACDEVADVLQKFPHMKQVVLPPSGELVLDAEDSLIASDLEGVPLDAAPPLLGTPSPAYHPKFVDDGSIPAPFFANGIEAFRHAEFNNEFVVAGHHTYDAADYATTKGFRFIINYARYLDEQGHLPPGTEWHKNVKFNWRAWMTSHGFTSERWDQLADVDLVTLLTNEGFLEVPGGGLPIETSLMLNLEESVLLPEQLRGQDYYPSEASVTERELFESKYYAGYINIYTAPVRIAHARGYSYVSIYGWNPMGRTWWDIGKPAFLAQSELQWQLYGEAIYQEIDGVNNSLYSFYWSPQNLAYTLANADLNLAKVAAQSVRKPVRPYYWQLLHGGGGGDRWWAYQPIPTEEARAITAMSFFTGVDGVVQYGWTGTSIFSAPPIAAVGANLMIGTPFDLAPSSPAGPSEHFARYEVVRVTDIDPSGVVHFQRVARELPFPYGLGPEAPTFEMTEAVLSTYLRPSSEPLSGMFEGMALVKPFERILRHGTVKIDVPASTQFTAVHPVSRRVKRDGVHVLVATDPTVAYGGSARELVLSDFDGRVGRSVRVPTDGETRVWLLVDSNCD